MAKSSAIRERTMVVDPRLFMMMAIYLEGIVGSVRRPFSAGILAAAKPCGYTQPEIYANRIYSV
jgi:hypothetical protein